MERKAPLQGITQLWNKTHGNSVFDNIWDFNEKDSTLAVGNFNPSLRHSEDKELGDRLVGAGFKILGDPNLTVYSLSKDSIFKVLELAIGDGTERVHEKMTILITSMR